jgi:hypothetical protein
MPAPVQPVTFYVRSSSTEPVDVRVAHSGLRMVLVNRESVGLLDDSWAVLGVYFLLGPSDDPDCYRAYVGEVGKRTLLVRIKEHISAKQWWSRALLIASASDEFNSAEIGWLEGRLYDVLNNAVAAEVMNKGRPGDDSLAAQDRGVLERYVEPIMAALRACGTSPDTADQKPPAAPAQKKKVYKESVKDLIDAGLLKAGTVLQPLRKGLTQTALVLADGNLKVGDQIFSAVSPAAMAVSGNKSEPGWDFWGAPSGEGGYVPLFTLRERLREDGGATEASVATPPSGSGAPGAAPTAPAPAAPEPDGVPTPEPSAPVARAEQSTARKKPRQFTETVADLLAAGLLHPGDELQSVRKALGEVRATVQPDGRLLFDGDVHGSLSAAAVAASGNKAEPGWEFWAVERDGKLMRLYDLRDQLRAAAAPQQSADEEA